MGFAFVSPAWFRNHLLTTVLIVAYVLMSALVYEQGRVIDNQRTLIRQLFGDNTELTARKIKELRTLNEHHSDRETK